MLRFCRRTQDPSLSYGSGCRAPYKPVPPSLPRPGDPSNPFPFQTSLTSPLIPLAKTELTNHSEPLFEPSTITNNGETTHRNPTVRDSLVALIPRTRTTRCIETRARALQGWREDVWVERLRTQKYVPGGHYAHHFDWGANVGGWGRVSSFMAWVGASRDLVGGGTEFPLLPSRGGSVGLGEAALGRDGGELQRDEERGKVEKDEEGGEVKKGGEEEDPWCRFVECEGGRVKTGPDGRGVTFKAVEGNAVFWTNFRADGSGDGYRETWHAGLPVTRGEKVGLNIWSWGRI